MPFAPIPQQDITFGAGPPIPYLPAANQIVSASFPLQPITTPNLLERFALNAFYLPVSVYGAGSPEPTTCRITPQLFVSGQLAFAQELDLSMAPVGGVWGVTPTANGFVSVTPNSPVDYRPGQTIRIGFQAIFDQALTINGGVTLAGTRDPVNGVVSVHGSIGYDIVREPAVFAL
jgi:hypothetical protein